MTVYADSSFIASLYTLEVHSPEARRRMESRPRVLLTPLNQSEFAHAFFSQVFRSRIPVTLADRALRSFHNDCRLGVWTVVDLPAAIWERSNDFARRYGPTLGVRTLDSLHVACALELGAEKFWTFDERQARLAAAVGLDTNP